jgi:hypothetical protein
MLRSSIFVVCPYAPVFWQNWKLMPMLLTTIDIGLSYLNRRVRHSRWPRRISRTLCRYGKYHAFQYFVRFYLSVCLDPVTECCVMVSVNFYDTYYKQAVCSLCASYIDVTTVVFLFYSHNTLHSLCFSILVPSVTSFILLLHFMSYVYLFIMSVKWAFRMYRTLIYDHIPIWLVISGDI